MDRSAWIWLGWMGAAGALGATVAAVARSNDLPARLPASARYLTLPSQAFPGSGHPGALVYVPDDVSDAQQRVLIYYHGHNGNIERLGPTIIAAMDAALQPYVLVMPQLRWNEANGDPGQLAHDGGVQRLLADVFAATPGLETWDVAQTRVDVASHSGGYVASAATIDHGSVSIGSVGLLDSLYGYSDTFDRFAVQATGGHFANVYGPSTETQSLALAARLATQLGSDATLNATGDHANLSFAWRASTVKSLVEHNAVPATYLTAMLNAFASAPSHG